MDIVANGLNEIKLFDVMFVWNYEMNQSAYLKHSAGVINQTLINDPLISTKIVIEACAKGKTLIHSTFDEKEAIALKDVLGTFALNSEIIPIEINNKKKEK